jgi:8-oxo-dGTP pyrophosphatase MutT (NUDIX family)
MNILNKKKYDSDKKLPSSYFCINCGKNGHHFKVCSFPVTSLGIICFKLYPNKDVKYLYILRRHSYSYVELVRSKNYMPDEYIEVLARGLTYEEKNVLLNLDFDTIWHQLWTVKDRGPFLRDYETSKEGFVSRIERVKNILNSIDIEYYEAEWGFPKGRRNYGETDLECAMREFREETQLKDSDYKIIRLNNLDTFTEEFQASNNVKYRHIYFPAVMITENEPFVDPNNYEQLGEVRRIEWKNIDEIKECSRKDNESRIDLLVKIDEAIKKKYYFDDLLNKEL